MLEDFMRVQSISISEAPQANSLTLTSVDSDAPLNPAQDKIEDVQILSKVSEVDIAAATAPITTQPVSVFEAESQENKNYKVPEDVDSTIPVHNQAQNSDVGGGLGLDHDEDYEGMNDGDEDSDASTHSSIRDIPPPIEQRSTDNNPTASTQVSHSLRLPDCLLSHQEPAEALFGVALIQVCKKFMNVVLDTAKCWRNVMIRPPCSVPKIIIDTLVQLSGASHLQAFIFPEPWNACEERQAAIHSLRTHWNGFRLRFVKSLSYWRHRKNCITQSERLCIQWTAVLSFPDKSDINRDIDNVGRSSTSAAHYEPPILGPYTEPTRRRRPLLSTTDSESDTSDLEPFLSIGLPNPRPRNITRLPRTVTLPSPSLPYSPVAPPLIMSNKIVSPFPGPLTANGLKRWLGACEDGFENYEDTHEKKLTPKTRIRLTGAALIEPQMAE
ncbi:hypothetical protein M422DRAFT_273723 [Sphaerobolus stellatus SS14]|uniref:Uncharacterized protein n=1 Tax=Sphaerobolus stellatus (strain SS14) TaxID=990650 RepID=A0A0C9UJ69_SPHS4|nr:hypothetical protein M422DRAFT_273723 [Sphaerobolus stellatus SS14]